MDEYVVESVAQDEQHVHVLARKPDGTLHQHTFPPSILGARCAEYGLDPDDIEAILDVILHEPFIPDSTTRLREGITDAAEAAGMVRGGRPVDLFNCDGPEQARAAHRARIDQAKGRVRVTIPRAAVRALDGLCPRDPDVIIAHAKRVAAARDTAQTRTVRRPRATLWEAPATRG